MKCHLTIEHMILYNLYLEIGEVCRASYFADIFLSFSFPYSPSSNGDRFSCWTAVGGSGQCFRRVRRFPSNGALSSLVCPARTRRICPQSPAENPADDKHEQHSGPICLRFGSVDAASACTRSASGCLCPESGQSHPIWFAYIAEVSQRVHEGHFQGTNIEPTGGQAQGLPLRGH